MVKGLVILSMLFNVLLAGSLAAYYFWRPDDAQFWVQYNREFTDEQRQFMRQDMMQAMIQARQDGAETIPEILAAAQNNASVQGARDSVLPGLEAQATPTALQELLVKATLNTRQNIKDQRRAEEMSVERFKMLNKEFPDFVQDVNERERQLQIREEDFNNRIKAYEDITRDTRLKQLIDDINKAKKPADMASLIQNRPVDEQLFVLDGLKPGARTAILQALPPEELAAIKLRGTRPLGETAGAGIAATGTGN